MPGHAHAHAARRVLGVFFVCEAPVARWHLPSVPPGVILTFLVIVDATRKQVQIAQKQRQRRVE